MSYAFNPFTGTFDYYVSGLPLSGGTMTGPITLYNGTNALTSGNYSIFAKSGVANGATAKGYLFDTTNVLSTSGSLYIDIRTGNTSKFSIGVGGILTSLALFKSTTALTVQGTRVNFQVAGSTSQLGVSLSNSVPSFTSNLFGALSQANTPFIAFDGIGYDLTLEGSGGINYFAPNLAMIAAGVAPDIGLVTAYWGNIFATGFGLSPATPVGQQTGGALTAGALYTANEQGMINTMWTALRAFGFLS